MIYFQRDRAETLHPDLYNCARCVRPEKELYARPVECPRCELSIKQEFYKAEIKRLVRERVGKFPKDYPLPELMALYFQVSMLLARNKNRIPKNWPVRTARLARILLDEKEQARRIDDWDFKERTRSRNTLP